MGLVGKTLRVAFHNPGRPIRGFIMKIKICLVLAACLLAVAFCGFSNPADKTILVNSSMPGAFVTFEKAAPRKARYRGEGANGVWLSLHNNYQVPIEVPTYSVEEPSETGVVYEIMSLDPNSTPELSQHHIDAFGLTQLQPGKSLLFSLPAEQLSKLVYLRVKFDFVGEDNATKGGPPPRHYAIFYGAAVADGSHSSPAVPTSVKQR